MSAAATYCWPASYLLLLHLLGTLTNVAQAQQQSTVSAGQRPNIVFIMADDVGWLNVGVYNQGMMAGRTPNLDKLASEGMRFTDYYAEAKLAL